MTYISVKLNIKKLKIKKLTHGLGDLSDGLHDFPLERINWNAVNNSFVETISGNQ